MVMDFAILYSNILIGWTEIVEASVEDVLMKAIIDLFLIPFISQVVIKLSGGTIVEIPFSKLMISLLVYIFIPFILRYFARRIIPKKGQKGFMEIKKCFPCIFTIGILIIIFFQ